MSIKLNDKNNNREILLAGISPVDQILNSVSKNPISNKAVYTALAEKIEKSVNDLIYYYSKNDVYNKAEVRQLIGQINTLTIEVVSSLPITDISTTTIYFVGPAAGTNTYDEYIYTNDAWAKIGDTSIDLTQYVTSANLTTILQSYYTKAEIDNLLNSYYTKTEINAELAEKQDTLTFDSVPTQNSNNPVKSGGVYSALQSQGLASAWELENKYGVHNWIPYPYSGPITANGITYTENPDGSITANGTATGLSMFYLEFKQTTDRFGDDYLVSGVPANAPSGVSISYRIGYYGGGGDVYRRGSDIRPGTEEPTVAFDGSEEQLHIYLRIAQGTTVNNLIFKPMIRDKTDPNNIWTPPALSNRDLTEKVVRPKLIHTAAANQTFSAQFKELYPYYLALSPQDKMNCFLKVYGNTVAKNTTMSSARFSYISFNSSSLDLNTGLYELNDSTPRAIEYSMKESTKVWSSLNVINNTNQYTTELYIC